jgi:hypothetical protein
VITVETAMRSSGLEQVPLTSGFRGRVCRLCSLPAKDARGNRDSAVPDPLCDVSKQQLAVVRKRATQLLQLGGVSILLLFQVP